MRSALIVVGGWLAASLSPADAARPVLAGEASFGAGGGRLLVHYATTGTDAVPAADGNTDGVPDFVAEVATTAELALVHFAALGFRSPDSDGTLGGDGRIDVYLRDLVAADGNAGVDVCTGGHCAGYIVAENDYAGFAYPSVGEGIRSVVPHELFHLVQYAYAMDQSSSWTEGTAVWAVEQLYGAENADFERFLPAFLTRTYRPFERAIAGFGDSYPYGAALWPYFLEHRFGVEVVVATWAACEQAPFLTAAAVALEPHGVTIDDAWVEFTRWNAFTGSRAGSSYPAALGWASAPREAAIDNTGTIYIEGRSARYVAIPVTRRSRVVVAPTSGIHVAAWLVADGAGLADGVELAPELDTLAATVEPGSYTLVVTGLSPGTITTAVGIAITEPPADDPGGCSSTSSLGAGSLLVILGFRRRRRRTR